MSDPKSTRYGGKLVHSLSDAVLLIAEEDVANCILRASEAPDGTVYNTYFANLSAIADAVQQEKTARGM